MEHLSEMQLAQYVDALMLDTQDQLPEEILAHVADCIECKVDVMGVLDLIESIEARTSFHHPHTR